MAYMKYKELTQYFNFCEKLDINNLPKDVKDFIKDGERALMAYAIGEDKFVLTNKKIILLDVGINKTNQKIHIFPFNSISSTALELKKNKSAILLSLDSGYQVRLNFVKMSEEEKNQLKQVYMDVINHISD